MPPEQVRGDAEQPWPRVGPGGVERAATVEGPDERLRCDLLGEVGADAPPGVAVESLEVALEDRPEQAGIGERAADHAPVRAGVTVVACPLLPDGS